MSNDGFGPGLVVGVACTIILVLWIDTSNLSNDLEINTLSAIGAVGSLIAGLGAALGAYAAWRSASESRLAANRVARRDFTERILAAYRSTVRKAERAGRLGRHYKSAGSIVYPDMATTPRDDLVREIIDACNAYDALAMKLAELLKNVRELPVDGDLTRLQADYLARVMDIHTVDGQLENRRRRAVTDRVIGEFKVEEDLEPLSFDLSVI